MIIKTGSYVGDGVDDKAITTGNAPDLIILRAVNLTTGSGAVAKTSTMAADAVKALPGNSTGLETGVIKSITATGFTVGTDTRSNSSGVTYHWLAVEADGDDFEVGSYAGNGSDNRTISLASITGTPAWVGVLGEAAAGAFHRTNIHSGDASGWFDNTSAHTTNGIQAFGAGTFQVGTRAQVNQGAGTPTYHYFAFTEVADKVEVVSFIGNATDNTSVTGAGFTPTFSLHQRITAAGRTMFLRGPAHVGDQSSFLSGVDDETDAIQAFEADGHQVGTHTNVNENLAQYAVIFFKGEAAAAAPTTRHLAVLGVGT